jgi:hypothetical protein
MDTGILLAKKLLAIAKIEWEKTVKLKINKINMKRSSFHSGSNLLLYPTCG